jgi:hypothetical protein
MATILCDAMGPFKGFRELGPSRATVTAFPRVDAVKTKG